MGDRMKEKFKSLFRFKTYRSKKPNQWNQNRYLQKKKIISFNFLSAQFLIGKSQILPFLYLVL